MAIQSRTQRRKETPRSPRWKRGPWLSIVIAILVVVSIVDGESWAIRQAPASDGSVGSAVASDLNRTLARIAAASVLIGPMD
jgi:predicted lipoprotein